jgi:hypothetical protein
MRYLLDTNIVIFILKEPAGALAARLARLPTADVVICSIVEAELYYGATKYGVPSGEGRHWMASWPRSTRCLSIRGAFLTTRISVINLSAKAKLLERMIC